MSAQIKLQQQVNIAILTIATHNAYAMGGKLECALTADFLIAEHQPQWKQA